MCACLSVSVCVCVCVCECVWCLGLAVQYSFSQHAAAMVTQGYEAPRKQTETFWARSLLITWLSLSLTHTHTHTHTQTHTHTYTPAINIHVPLKVNQLSIPKLLSHIATQLSCVCQFECVCVCVCERESVCECVCEKERERARKSVIFKSSVWTTERGVEIQQEEKRESVCVRQRKCVSVCVCVCVCVCQSKHPLTSEAGTPPRPISNE